MIAPHTHNEEARLKMVAAYRAVDKDNDGAYDDFTQIASQIAQVPIALITLIDRDMQIFKAKIGIEGGANSRDDSFCAHAILDPLNTMKVEDATKDIRFADNPLVKDDIQIKFYCGVPLVTEDNFALGTLCVIDKRPRILSPEQEGALQALARRIMNRMEIHKTFHDLEKAMRKTNADFTASEEVEDLATKLERLLLQKPEPVKRTYK